MRTKPATIPECDEQLTRTHNSYLAAVDTDDLECAAALWMELHDLLDLRLHLKQRGPSE